MTTKAAEKEIGPGKSFIRAENTRHMGSWLQLNDFCTIGLVVLILSIVMLLQLG